MVLGITNKIVNDISIKPGNADELGKLNLNRTLYRPGQMNCVHKSTCDYHYLLKLMMAQSPFLFETVFTPVVNFLFHKCSIFICQILDYKKGCRGLSR